MSDADVVREVLAGRDEAFGTLVKRHFAAVYGLCLSYIKDATEAEDAAQETFVQGYRRLDTLKNPGKFPGWLASIARNICMNRLKSNSRRDRLLADYAENGMEQERVVDAERIELRQTVRRKVDDLPPKTREAVYLYYFEEKSLKEIGEYLGKSPNAVARLLKYGRRVLKDKLWEEAADSIRGMRPKKESVLKACTAIPLGKAAWCVKGGTAAAAAAAGKTVTLGGVLSMSSKSVVSAVGVVVIALMALVVWSPWSEKPPSVQDEEVAISRTEPAKEELPEAHVELARVQPAPEAAPAGEEMPVAVTEETAPPLVEEEEERSPVAASVSGRVIDNAGYPFEGATVTLEVSRDKPGIDVIKSYTAQTGADGTYGIPGIDTFGRAFPFASAEGYVMQRGDGFTLAPGMERNDVDFTLPKAEFVVAGWVVSVSNRPIPDASVRLRYYGYTEAGLELTATTGGTTGPITSSKWSFAITDEQGYFQMGIPGEGLCDFTVVKDGYGKGFFPKIPTGTEDALFVLRSAGSIAGRVTKENGGPVEGATVRVVGGALPGGLPFTNVKIQVFPLSPVVVVTDSNGDYIADGLGEDYVYMVSVDDRLQGVAGLARRLVSAAEGTTPYAAREIGIRVKAGQTTSGVDFVLADSSWAEVYGTVKDGAGLPVCPLWVCAKVVDPGDGIVGQLGGETVTGGDGSYKFRMNLTEPHNFRVYYWYRSEGGSPGLPENAEVAILELGPGVKKELNFTAPAPLIVPVRYVDPDGTPVKGVMAGMRLAGRSGGWGGYHANDEGRFTWHGLDPARTYEAVAWERSEGGIVTVAASEPFTGEPGETVPEVVVVCIPRGGIEGIVLDADGNPAANTEIGYAALLEDGTTSPMRTATTNANGAFCMLGALPEGVHPSVFVGCQKAEDKIELAVVANAEIVRDSVTDLGVIRLDQQYGSIEEVQEQLLGVE